MEDLVKACPDAVGFLIDKDLPRVVCGEPFWDSFAELAHQKGWDDRRLEELIAQLNRRCR